MPETNEPETCEPEGTTPRLITHGLSRDGRALPLWLVGGPAALDGVRVGVIGSRRPLPGQAAVARSLAAALVDAGAAVISGGALGVDAIAQSAALDAGGRTALVSPAAPEADQPAANRALFERCRTEGALLSPFEPGTPLRRSHFRVRNRALARLIDALIVVCADTRSGSLHCAGEAWRRGVPVLAVPWSPGTAHALGSNHLLASGARALPDAAAVRRLIAQLSTPGALLRRDDKLGQPGSPTPGARAQPRLAGTARPTGRGTPQTATLAPSQPSATKPAAPCPPSPPPLRDAATRRLYERLAAAPEGASLEALLAAGGLDRDAASATLLGWTLSGHVARDPWGRYRASSGLQA